MLTSDISRVLQDENASDWLKQSLWQSMSRDPVDAANDAEILNALLQARTEQILAG